MEIKLSNFGTIISTDDTSNEIFKFISDALSKIKLNEVVIIDAQDVVISTKSARLIFGSLYRKLTKTEFNKKINFKNGSPTFIFALNEGILTELQSV